MAQVVQIGSKGPGQYGYVCSYKGKRVEVYAPTTLAAQTAAATHFRAKKAWEVSTTLCERPDDSEVVHTAVD